MRLPLIEWYGTPWASCQICKIAGCACAGNAGNVFPALAIPTCITARAPCTCLGSLRSGILWSRCREKRTRHSRRMRNPQFYVSSKRPIYHMSILFFVTSHFLSQYISNLFFDKYINVILTKSFGWRTVNWEDIWFVVKPNAISTNMIPEVDWVTAAIYGCFRVTSHAPGSDMISIDGYYLYVWDMELSQQSCFIESSYIIAVSLGINFFKCVDEL